MESIYTNLVGIALS